MAEYWVDIIRREVSFERYTVWVEADNADDARSRVTAHYLGDGDGVLTYEEENSEQHVKSLEVDESQVVAVGDAVEAA
jgi:hypothetical protein